MRIQYYYVEPFDGPAKTLYKPLVALVKTFKTSKWKDIRTKGFSNQNWMNIYQSELLLEQWSF